VTPPRQATAQGGLLYRVQGDRNLPDVPFGVSRPQLFTEDQLRRIHEAAVTILIENGIRVNHAAAREAAARAGLRVAGDRVLLERSVINEFVAASMAEGKVQPWRPAPLSADIVLDVHRYPQNVHVLATDEIAPFTTETLIEATKLVDTLAERGVRGYAPGIPADVPSDLEQLLQYKIAAQYCRDGKHHVEIRNARMLPYAMEMAEVLGNPVHGFDTYVVTPLRLNNEFLDVLMADGSGLTYVTVNDMTSVGATTPIRVPDALALAAAEVIGCAIILREITPLEIHWSVRVCPIDMHSMALSLGSPEEILFQLAGDEVNAFYHGYEPWPPGGNLHSQAKLPDAQAAAERMAQMTFGVLCGSRSFGGAGTLSLDEVFSAEQLMIDCEMRDHVARLIRGIDPECDPVAAAAEAALGVKEGFLGLDTTAMLARQVYWAPRLFERRALAGWERAGQPSLRRQAKDMAHEQLKRFNYELESELLRKIEAIYARAYSELA